MAIPEWLYRGVSLGMHDRNRGVLQPKVRGTFEYGFKWGERGAKWGQGGTWGTSEGNAIVRHQLDQEGFPTSGVSTTPYIERAEVYALHNERPGVIYKISTAECGRCSVRTFRVADTVRPPSVPEDDEFILVAFDCGAIPSEVVVEVIRVGSG